LTIIFYPFVRPLQYLSGTQSLSSGPSDSLETARNAVLQAIKYMETVHKNVLKDFKYPKMEKLKMENEILHR
jgi:hypothetical protein